MPVGRLRRHAQKDLHDRGIHFEEGYVTKIKYKSHESRNFPEVEGGLEQSERAAEESEVDE